MFFGWVCWHNEWVVVGRRGRLYLGWRKNTKNNDYITHILDDMAFRGDLCADPSFTYHYL
jgi:hypothetical protein